MCHGLEPVWIHVLGPFNLETSGFISGMFFMNISIVSLISHLFHYPLPGTPVVGLVGPLALTLELFFFSLFFPVPVVCFIWGDIAFNCIIKS